MRPIVGGFLLQDSGGDSPGLDAVTTVTERHPSDDEVRDMFFAWRVVRHVTSNAVVYCRDRTTAGIGAGQMSRVDSAWIAGLKSRDRFSTEEGGGTGRGLVAASDAFPAISGRDFPNDGCRRHCAHSTRRLPRRFRGHSGGERRRDRNDVHGNPAIQPLKLPCGNHETGCRSVCRVSGLQDQ